MKKLKIITFWIFLIASMIALSTAIYAAVLIGTDLDDVIHGTIYDDIIKGNDGNDELHGEQGDDKIYGGNGDDLIFGWEGNDIIYGNKGNDEIIEMFGSNILYGGNGNDLISIGGLSTTATNYLYGGNGNDELGGYLGIDYIYGENGNDKLTGVDNHDYLYGGTGSDYLDAGPADDTYIYEIDSSGLFNNDFYYDSNTFHPKIGHIDDSGIDVLRIYADYDISMNLHRSGINLEIDIDTYNKITILSFYGPPQLLHVESSKAPESIEIIEFNDVTFTLEDLRRL